MVEDIRDGIPVRNLGKKYGISRSQVYRFLKNKGSPPVRSRDVPLHSKIRVKKSKYPIIDQAVFEWFLAMSGAVRIKCCLSQYVCLVVFSPRVMFNACLS